jgi:tRNA G18 (ribose-2'-O)-methylase SpoU
MADLDEQTPEWRGALRLVRAAADAAPGPAREQALAAARAFLAGAAHPRLRRLAGNLAPGADDRAILCALVPLERVDARTRVTDADLGIADADAPGAAPDRFPLVAVADNLRSALNVGGLFRTADFAGAEALWLCGYTAAPDHPQVARSALGAERAVPWRAFPDVREAVAAARAGGRRVYALETSSRAAPIDRASFEWPAALLLGSERFGLDPDVVASADACLAIPGHGTKNSLNVVSAFAIAAYAMRTAWERR